MQFHGGFNFRIMLFVYYIVKLAGTALAKDSDAPSFEFRGKFRSGLCFVFRQCIQNLVQALLTVYCFIFAILKKHKFLNS